MSWLLVTWFLAFGYVPIQDESVGLYKVELDHNRVATVSQIGIDAQAFERFHAFTSIETFQYFDTENYSKGGIFEPYRADYIFGASFSFNDHITIVASHECDHVIKLWWGQTEWYESSETKIVLRIDGSSKF